MFAARAADAARRVERLATLQHQDTREPVGYFARALQGVAASHCLQHQVRAIITEVAAASPVPGTVAAKVGDLYASFMDEEAVEARGSAPLDADLARVATVSGPADVVAVAAGLAREGVLGSGPGRRC